MWIASWQDGENSASLFGTKLEVQEWVRSEVSASRIVIWDNAVGDYRELDIGEETWPRSPDRPETSR